MSRHPLLFCTAAGLCALVFAAACGDARGEGGDGPQGQRGGPGGPGGPGGRGGNDRPTPVEIVTVGRGTVSRTSTVASILEPLRAVGVNAQLSGILLSVRVEEGNYVRQGQVLAQIDARELEAQVKSAEAALEFAESTAKRSDELFRQQIITAAEYERDRAALASGQATLDQLRTRLGYATLRAPISGVVTEKRAETGDIVSPQTRIFSVADVSVLVARAMVSELDVPSLQAGATADLTVDALGGAKVSGRIRRVFPSADSTTRLVPVEVALSGSALSQLRPGNTVRVTFRLGTRQDALLIPTRAVMGPAGARTVMIVQGGMGVRRPVRVGPDIDGQTEVFEGLVVGDTVVVAGNMLLREGAPVRIVPPLSPLESPSSATPAPARSESLTPRPAVRRSE